MLLYSTEEEWPFRDIVESTTGGDMFVKLKIKKKTKKNFNRKLMSEENLRLYFCNVD